MVTNVTMQRKPLIDGTKEHQLWALAGPCCADSEGTQRSEIVRTRSSNGLVCGVSGHDRSLGQHACLGKKLAPAMLLQGAARGQLEMEEHVS